MSDQDVATYPQFTNLKLNEGLFDQVMASDRIFLRDILDPEVWPFFRVFNHQNPLQGLCPHLAWMPVHESGSQSIQKGPQCEWLLVPDHRNLPLE